MQNSIKIVLLLFVFISAMISHHLIFVLTPPPTLSALHPPTVGSVFSILASAGKTSNDIELKERQDGVFGPKDISSTKDSEPVQPRKITFPSRDGLVPNLGPGPIRRERGPKIK